jgi:hypothetical protein
MNQGEQIMQTPSAHPRPFVRIATRADGSRKKIRLYIIWESMIQRCHNPKQTSYYRYGGRGIRVCDAWRKSYAEFRAWAVSHGYAKGLTLDRREASGNYEPDNCRWIPAREQQWNQRNNHRLTLNGVTKTLPVWAHELGMSPDLLRSRKTNGWTDEQILTTPLLPTGIWREGVQHQPRGRRPNSVSSANEGVSK